MTTLRSRFNLPLLLLLIIAPLLIGGVFVGTQQFVRIAKVAPLRLDNGGSWSLAGRSSGSRSGTGSDVSPERTCDEVISRFMNQETTGAPNVSLVGFFFLAHGLVIGCLSGAMKTKLI